MKLLVLAFDLPPAATPLALQAGRLLQHWPKPDNLFVAHALDPSAPAPSCYPELAQRFAGHLPQPFSQAVWRRLGRRLDWSATDPFARWWRATLRAIEQQWSGERFDRLLTFADSASSGALVSELAFRWRLPWTLFAGDHWTRLDPKRQMDAVAEARQIVVASDDARLMLVKRHPLMAAKFTVIPPSFDPELYPDPPPDLPARGGPLLLSHVAGQTLEPLLAALERALATQQLDGTDVRLQLVGPLPAKVEALIQQPVLQPVVTVVDRPAYRQHLQHMRQADVLVLTAPCAAGSLAEWSSLVDCLGAARPILALVPPTSATAQVLRDTQGGWQTDQPEQIAQLLIELVNARIEGRLQRHTPSAAALRRFDIGRNAPLLRDMICSDFSRFG